MILENVKTESTEIFCKSCGRRMLLELPFKNEKQLSGPSLFYHFSYCFSCMAEYCSSTDCVYCEQNQKITCRLRNTKEFFDNIN